jgi:hypothetical protein
MSEACEVIEPGDRILLNSPGKIRISFAGDISLSVQMTKSFQVQILDNSKPSDRVIEDHGFPWERITDPQMSAHQRLFWLSFLDKEEVTYPPLDASGFKTGCFVLSLPALMMCLYYNNDGDLYWSIQMTSRERLPVINSGDLEQYQYHGRQWRYGGGMDLADHLRNRPENKTEPVPVSQPAAPPSPHWARGRLRSLLRSLLRVDAGIER